MESQNSLTQRWRNDAITMTTFTLWCSDKLKVNRLCENNAYWKAMSSRTQHTHVPSKTLQLLVILNSRARPDFVRSSRLKTNFLSSCCFVILFSSFLLSNLILMVLRALNYIHKINFISISFFHYHIVYICILKRINQGECYQY